MAITKAINITELGYMLMGLLSSGPMSGYAIRQILETTPLGHYSDSPGSIYPALKKLQALGCIEQVKTTTQRSTVKKTFAITCEGQEALKSWFEYPTTSTHLMGKHMPRLLLRFSFMSAHVSSSHMKQFLKRLIADVEEYHKYLEQTRAALSNAMDLSGKLALNHGILSAKMQIAWAKEALKAL